MDVRERLTVRSSVAACKSCELHKTARQPIAFRGSSDPEVVLLGEAPGKYEDVAGEVFVGPSGKLLHKLLADANLDCELAFLNVVSCFPNRTPTDKEVSVCGGNVNRQLSHLRPKIIVALGGIAVSRWWRNIRVGDIRGKWWLGRETDGDGGPCGIPPWVTATWHPAAILRNGSLADDCVSDLRRVRRILATGGRDPLAVDGGAMGYPFNPTCIVCGELGDVWMGSDSEISSDGLGALAWCQKHYERRMGLGGGGRTKPPAKKAVSKAAAVVVNAQEEMF